MMPLVTVGFINYSNPSIGYSSKKYLKLFLETLAAQTYENLEVICLDNGSTDNEESLQMIKEFYPGIKIIRNKENTGFIAHNQIIAEGKGKYYLCINFDLLLDPHYIKNLVDFAEAHPDVGTFGGSIYRWDFAKNVKTEYLDATGITISPSHHLRERETGVHVPFVEIEKRNPEEVFGISGVSVMFNKQALEDIYSVYNYYFDPLFVIYKEEVDLMYRLRWLGWKSWYIPSALAWHDRTLGEKQKFRLRNLTILTNRKHKSEYNRRQSIRNHLCILYKNFSFSFSLKVKVLTFWDEIRKFFWVLLFESFALSAYKDFWRMRKELKVSKKSVAPEEIEKLMM
ncbi:MAG: glycosyltransferase [Candidatus Gracilibacteria bacterium]